jgi:hypothetical protein
MGNMGVIMLVLVMLVSNIEPSLGEPISVSHDKNANVKQLSKAGKEYIKNSGKKLKNLIENGTLIKKITLKKSQGGRQSHKKSNFDQNNLIPIKRVYRKNLISIKRVLPSIEEVNSSEEESPLPRLAKKEYRRIELNNELQALALKIKSTEEGVKLRVKKRNMSLLINAGVPKKLSTYHLRPNEYQIPRSLVSSSSKRISDTKKPRIIFVQTNIRYQEASCSLIFRYQEASYTIEFQIPCLWFLYLFCIWVDLL